MAHQNKRLNLAIKRLIALIKLVSYVSINGFHQSGGQPDSEFSLLSVADLYNQAEAASAGLPLSPSPA